MKFCYNTNFTQVLNNPKDLDPSCKMDLDLRDCFGRKTLHLITEEIRYTTSDFFQTKHNLCVIMISEIVWEKYRSGTGFSEPFVIHFPDYSKGLHNTCDPVLGLVVQN